MPNYELTIQITSDESELNLESDVQAAVGFLEDRGINVTAWVLVDVEKED